MCYITRMRAHARQSERKTRKVYTVLCAHGLSRNRFEKSTSRIPVCRLSYGEKVGPRDRTGRPFVNSSSGPRDCSTCPAFLHGMARSPRGPRGTKGRGHRRTEEEGRSQAAGPLCRARALRQWKLRASSVSSGSRLRGQSSVTSETLLTATPRTDRFLRLMVQNGWRIGPRRSSR